MYNGKEIRKVLKKNAEPAKRPDPYGKNVSEYGYRDDSPYRDSPYLNIFTPDGTIDMSNTGIPLMANNRYLPAYSGMHQFKPGFVKETKIAKEGISMVSLNNLAPTQNLAKKDKNIVANIKNAISRGEFIEPLSVKKSGENYKIKDGHHRYLAYKELGINNVPVNTAAYGGDPSLPYLEQAQDGRVKSYNPNLANQDIQFQNWYSKNTVEGQQGVPYSDKQKYDYYSFFKSGKNGNIQNHFPDTFKRPSHDTFSDESIYSTPENPGGHWFGDIYNSPINKVKGKFVYGGGLDEYQDGGKTYQAKTMNEFNSLNKSYSDSLMMHNEAKKLHEYKIKDKQDTSDILKYFTAKEKGKRTSDFYDKNMDGHNGEKINDKELYAIWYKQDLEQAKKNPTEKSCFGCEQGHKVSYLRGQTGIEPVGNYGYHDLYYAKPSTKILPPYKREQFWSPGNQNQYYDSFKIADDNSQYTASSENEYIDKNTGRRITPGKSFTKDGKYLPSFIENIQEPLVSKSYGGWLDELPMAQDGLWKKGLETAQNMFDNYLGHPMDKAHDTAEKYRIGDNDQADNFRHPLAGRYTAEAIAKKTKSPLLGFLGSTALGIGHEIMEPNRGEINKPMSWTETIREGAEDVFNNMVGAGVGSSNLSPAKKTALLKYLSDKNMLPDGYGGKDVDMYWKEDGGELDKYQEGSTVNEESKQFLKDMTNSPLFNERYARMTGQQLPVPYANTKDGHDQNLYYPAEQYKKDIINNLNTVKYAPVGEGDFSKRSDELTPAAYYQLPTLGVDPELQFAEKVLKDKGFKKRQPESYEFFQKKADEIKEQKKKEHTIFINKGQETSNLHETSHASTLGTLSFAKDYPYIIDPQLNQEGVDRYTKHKRYYSTPTEIKARVDVTRKGLKDAGLYDATKAPFTEKDYNNLEKYQDYLFYDSSGKFKADDKSMHSNEQLHDIKSTHSKEDFIRMMNDIVSNKPNQQQPTAEFGGETDEYRTGGPVNPLQLSRNKRRKTSKNIQSSINELFLRNYTLYGPGGRNIYDPKSKFETGGGWLDNYQDGGLRATSTSAAIPVSTQAPVNSTGPTNWDWVKHKWNTRDKGPSDWNLAMMDKYGNYVDSGVDPFTLMLTAPQQVIKVGAKALKGLLKTTNTEPALMKNIDIEQINATSEIGIADKLDFQKFMNKLNKRKEQIETDKQMNDFLKDLQNINSHLENKTGDLNDFAKTLDKYNSPTFSKHLGKSIHRSNAYEYMKKAQGDYSGSEMYGKFGAFDELRNTPFILNPKSINLNKYGGQSGWLDTLEDGGDPPLRAASSTAATPVSTQAPVNPTNATGMNWVAEKWRNRDQGPSDWNFPMMDKYGNYVDSGVDPFTAFLSAPQQVIKTVNTTLPKAVKAIGEKFKSLKGLPNGANTKAIVSSVDDVGNLANQFRKNPLSEKELEMYKWFKDKLRFDKLPKTTNKESLSVLEDFKTRIQTPEGKKRMKELGIDNDKMLQKLEIVEDPNTFGYYTGYKNKIVMNPQHPLPKKVVRHEIEHGVQNAMSSSKIDKVNYDSGNFKYLFNPKKGTQAKFDALKPTSEIDDLLSGLELRREGTPNKVWNTEMQDSPVNIDEYKSAILNKQNATDYFLTGSTGKEKSAFLGEVQQYMMDAGTIPKKGYVEITPEMVKNTMVDAMFDEKQGGKFLRLFNIMKASDTNYDLVAKGLNKMLGLVPVGLGVGAAASQEQRYGGQQRGWLDELY